MDKWWKTLDKAGDERGTRGDKRDLCQDCLRLFHTAGIMKGRNRWGALLGMLVSDGAGDGVREGSHPLALSRGCSGGNLDFQRGRFDCSGGEFGFRRNGRGALRSPTPPRGTGRERVYTLSRSPMGLHWQGFEFPTVQAFRRRIWLPTKRAWGAPLPYIPSGDGVREGATLSRSPGAVLAGIWISDGAGIPAKNLVSGEAGVGRSAPLHPLG